MKKRQDMPGTAASTPPAKIQRTKPQAHQNDLEAQNEELLQVRDMLEESRNRYIDFYDFSPVGYLTLSHKALITEINLTGAVMLGEERSNLRRRRFAEFLALEDNDFWNRHFMAARQHEGKLTCELNILRGDGSRMDVQIDSLRLAIDSQEPVVRLALTDITERKRAEAALRASEAQRRLLEQQKIIQTSLDGFWVARVKDARILDANEAFCNMVGYARAELLTMSIYDLEAAESPVETAERIKRIMKVGSDRFETRHRHKQGHLIDLEVSVSYSESDGGVHFVFVRNITERKRMEQVIAAREQELRSVADSAPFSIIRYDLNGRMRYMNSPMLQYFGIPSTELLGKLPHEVWPDGRFAEIERGLAQVLETEVGVVVEYSELDVEGKTLHHQVLVVPEKDSLGEVVGIIAFGLNVTERKQAEALLMQREREFRTLAEGMPDNIVRYNREGVTVYVNPVLERTLGDRATAMIGTTPREYHPDGSYDDYAQLLDTVLASGEAGELEKILPAPDGKDSVHQIRMVPEHGENGEVVGVLSIGRDITERKQSEEALRVSEQKYRTLAENMPFILVRYDREGCRTYVNPSAERSFGFVGEQVIGKTLPEINPLRIPTVEAYQRALKHTLTTGERSEFEMQVSLASGDVRIGNTVIVAERAVDGEICGAITIGRDITQLKQAEQQLRELTVHLQTVREEEKSHLAREIHDDLGSTLAALNLKISLLLDFELTEEMKKTPLLARLESLLPLVENAVAATRRIITDMRPDVLDNLGLFAALKWQAEQFHQHTGIMCRIICANDRGCLDCRGCVYQLDKTQSINMFRIFQEALTNVARHSGASKVVTEYRPETDYVFLSVSDNGCGLPEGHDAASTSFGIRGMRERIGQLGGDIMFDTPPGGGLRVAVRVPLAGAGVR